MKNLSLIGLPVYSLSAYRDMALAVRALREAGITEILRRGADSFFDLGDVNLVEITADSGPSNLRNFPQFLQNTEALRVAVSKVGAEDFVFCLGGGCELIVGVLAGLRTTFKGEPGIVWMDAHGDFNTPETSPSGYIGGMGLAMACGRGPQLTSAIEGMRPLLSEENVVHTGNRALDSEEERAMASSPMKVYSASVIHSQGAANIANEAAEYLLERSDWIVCHLDVDVLDPEIIPAVRFPVPNGLTINEATTIIETLQRKGKLKVFDLAAYNPTTDNKHTSCNRILELVSELFPS